MKVEELERFGAKLQMPKEAVKAQGKIMLRALRKRFGILGMLGIFKDTWVNQRRLKRDHPETRRKAAAMSEIFETELFTFSAMFLALARRLGREEAYEFFKTEVMNKIARTSMGLLYQLEDLKRCEGDTFDRRDGSHLACSGLGDESRDGFDPIIQPPPRRVVRFLHDDGD